MFVKECRNILHFEAVSRSIGSVIFLFWNAPSARAFDVDNVRGWWTSVQSATSRCEAVDSALGCSLPLSWGDLLSGAWALFHYLFRIHMERAREVSLTSLQPLVARP